MQTGRLLIFAVLICGGVFGMMADTRADEITIKTVYQRLREWRLKFTNLRLVSQRTSPDELKHRFPDLTAEQLEGFYHRTDLIWTETGAHRLDTEHSEGGRLISRSSKFTDGKVDFEVEYGRGGDMADTAKAFIQKRQELRQIAPGSVYPLRHVVQSNLWLYEVLEHYQAKILREETLDGARCVVVELKRPNVDRTLLWLDIERNCLPRRGEDHKPQYSPTTFIVEEFREVEPGFWFPDKGRYQSSPTEAWQFWHVVDVKINTALPEALFQMPPLSQGTRVSNRVENREYVVDNAPFAGVLEPMLAPEAFSRTLWSLAGAALVLGIVGWMLYIRHRAIRHRPAGGNYEN